MKLINRCQGKFIANVLWFSCLSDWTKTHSFYRYDPKSNEQIRYRPYMVWSLWDERQEKSFTKVCLKFVHHVVTLTCIIVYKYTLSWEALVKTIGEGNCAILLRGTALQQSSTIAVTKGLYRTYRTYKGLIVSNQRFRKMALYVLYTSLCMTLCLYTSFIYALFIDLLKTFYLCDLIYSHLFGQLLRQYGSKSIFDRVV